MIITSGQQMRDFGASLAAHLVIGDVVILSGPLGAGKTTLVQGLGQALGVEGEITSPTFVIARYHKGSRPLIHVDAYRLRPDGGGTINPNLALEDLDLDPATGITVMEWGDDLGRALADSYLQITIAFIDDNTRDVHYQGYGERWTGVTL